MRIGEAKVCQRVADDVIVLLDENDGTEVLFSDAEAELMMTALYYFGIPLLSVEQRRAL